MFEPTPNFVFNIKMVLLGGGGGFLELFYKAALDGIHQFISMLAKVMMADEQIKHWLQQHNFIK